MSRKYLEIIGMAFLAVGCTAVPMDTDSLQSMTFAGMAEEAGTRTGMDAGGNIVWTTADRITVFSGIGTGRTFQVASTEQNGTVATFTGLSTTSATGYYYAVYPAQEDATLVAASGTVNASLPTVQAGVAGSFADGASLSLARVNADAATDGDILHFRNAGALLAFKVPGNYVTSVRISSRNGDVPMTGGANIRYNDGEPVVSATTTSKNYVEVNGLSGNIGKIFYAVVYPGDYSDGFEVSFITGSIYNTYRSTKPLTLGRNANVLLIDKDWSVADDRTGEHAGYERLITPVISSCTQTGSGAVTLRFSCASGKKSGYKFYRRDAAAMGPGTLVATLSDASATSYTFTGLTTGASYDFGVAAYTGETGFADSETAWQEDLTVGAAASSVSVQVTSTAENYYNFVVNYRIRDLASAGAEHGLLFSYTDKTPTCGSVGAEGKLPGPVIGSTGTANLSQCVPNAVLSPGKPCYIRAYCFDNDAGNYVYSPVSTLTLASQPGGYSISRTAQPSPSGDVGVYRFTAGGTWNGYYAVADCSASSPIRLKVRNVPNGTVSTATVASQGSSSGALTLINGQIFGQGNIGIAYTGGALRYNPGAASSMRGYSNVFSPWQPVTRAILGVDADGAPGAFWSSLIDGTAWFFDRPIPAGTGVYDQVSASSGPGPKRAWSPAEALSTGPMLLYGGNVCVSEDRLATGVYYTNYELWDGNIYGSSRQRTAIGYDSATGKVYLCVTTSSCTQTTLARIMKGLGCDYAMALDGGGSSCMYVKGSGTFGYNTSRAVASTVGFFER